jgi:glycine hydroxymethyltransferase
MMDDGMVTGTPALTSRGFIEEDFAKVAEYFDLAVKIALKIKAESQGIYKKSFGSVYFFCVMLGIVLMYL